MEMLKCLVIDLHEDNMVALDIVNKCVGLTDYIVKMPIYNKKNIKSLNNIEDFHILFFVYSQKYFGQPLKIDMNSDFIINSQSINKYLNNDELNILGCNNNNSFRIKIIDTTLNDDVPNDIDNNQFHMLSEENRFYILMGNYYYIRDQIIDEVQKIVISILTRYIIDDYKALISRGIGNITRSIEFPPEYHQAGLNILNYFSTIINQRYPEIPVTVRIEQEGLKVRMSVQTPEGHHEIVEQTLQAYGLVVTGRMAPEELLENPYQVMALKHKLEMAAMELRHTRELLQSAERYNEQQQSRILSLEADVTHLRQFIGSSLQHNQELTVMLQSLLNSLRQQHDTAIHQALSTLKEVLARGITPTDEEVVKGALSTIKEKEPGVFRQIVDLLGKGAITGTAGRLLYDWLIHLSTVLR